MPDVRKPSVSVKGELRFTIPPALLHDFREEPRFIIKPFPGILLLDIKILRETDLLKKLSADKAFSDKFDIVLMPKG